jgi:hypothetical protein
MIIKKSGIRLKKLGLAWPLIAIEFFEAVNQNTFPKKIGFSKHKPLLSHSWQKMSNNGLEKF